MKVCRSRPVSSVESDGPGELGILSASLAICESLVPTPEALKLNTGSTHGDVDTNEVYIVSKLPMTALVWVFT